MTPPQGHRAARRHTFDNVFSNITQQQQLYLQQAAQAQSQNQNPNFQMSTPVPPNPGRNVPFRGYYNNQGQNQSQNMEQNRPAGNSQG